MFSCLEIKLILYHPIYRWLKCSMRIGMTWHSPLHRNTSMLLRILLIVCRNVALVSQDFLSFLISVPTQILADKWEEYFSLLIKTFNKKISKKKMKSTLNILAKIVWETHIASAHLIISWKSCCNPKLLTGYPHNIELNKIYLHWCLLQKYWRRTCWRISSTENKPSMPRSLQSSRSSASERDSTPSAWINLSSTLILWKL